MITSEKDSLKSVLTEVGASAKDLVLGEVDLVKAEVKDAAKQLTRHLAETISFSFLLGMSILPFLAFLIIGGGELMNGQYWLSSLLVAVLTAGIGGTLAYRSYQQLKEKVDLPKTKTSVDHTIEASKRSVA